MTENATTTIVAVKYQKTAPHHLENGSVLEIIAFPNDYKTKENQPDIRIYRREPYAGGETRSAPPPKREAALAPKAEETGYTYPEEDINPEDIPF